MLIYSKTMLKTLREILISSVVKFVLDLQESQTCSLVLRILTPTMEAEETSSLNCEDCCEPDKFMQ